MGDEPESQFEDNRRQKIFPRASEEASSGSDNSDDSGSREGVESREMRKKSEKKTPRGSSKVGGDDKTPSTTPRQMPIVPKLSYAPPIVPDPVFTQIPVPHLSAEAGRYEYPP